MLGGRRARDLCIEAARKRDELIAGHREGAAPTDDNNISSGSLCYIIQIIMFMYLLNLDYTT